MATAAELTLQELRDGLAFRKQLDKIFVAAGLAILFGCLGILTILIFDLLRDGAPRFGWDFLTSFPSRKAEHAGILSAAVGTSLIMLLTALVALPIGVAAAIYLEEYAPKNWLTAIIEINVTNLAGVPSIVYGLLALGLFVYQFNLGNSILSAGLTLALPDPADHHRRDARVAARGPEGDTRGGVRARCNALGGHQGSRASVFHGRHPDGPDPRPVACHRRDRADHHDRCVELHRVPATVARDRRVPVPQFRVAQERVHGDADPDVQLGLAPRSEVPGKRGRGRRDPADHDAVMNGVAIWIRYRFRKRINW
jgi:hypothetical protein